MQDNLINPQTVDKVIHSLFDSYEKFILSLIQRRKKLEEQKSQLTKNLKGNEKETSLIKKVLSSFHGMKVGKQFYDGQSESLQDHKPENRSDVKTNPMEAIGKWLLFNKEEYNKMAKKEIINNETLYSKSSLENKVSYQPTPLKIYQNEALNYLKASYFPRISIPIVEKNMNLHDFDKKTVIAFKKGISSEDFANTIARGIGLQNVNRSKNMKM